ncbi:MAG: hypothetical protein Q9191_001097 [Dirinaria sp. TL-2023a]
MLSTPSTSHVNINRVYEPAEDSFLLLDTLSSSSEIAFLHGRFSSQDGSHGFKASSPVVLEVGTGSGIVIAFITAHSRRIFGRSDILTLGSDLNAFACKATVETVEQASQQVTEGSCGLFLSCVKADLASALGKGTIDVLIFNPPYVPTEKLPEPPSNGESCDEKSLDIDVDQFENESRLLSLSYAGGQDGMEVTHRLLEELPGLLSVNQGVAYVLLCQQNKPTEVMDMIRHWGSSWAVKVVGRSGRTGGWEKLLVLRIWRQ